MRAAQTEGCEMSSLLPGITAFHCTPKAIKRANNISWHNSIRVVDKNGPLACPKDNNMPHQNILLSTLPKPLKKSLRSAQSSISSVFIKNFGKKYDSELAFWRSRLEIDNGTFSNAHYERIMLGMAQESNKEFLRGKIVVDFGCGPRGSLTWGNTALLRIGIDVLADRYADEFTDNIVSHNMIYLKSTEKVIPLPSNFVDIMFTLNAIDHVYNFHTMCNEILRILKPGGTFIGSFNLEEPASVTEPQRLTENILKENLLAHLDIESYRLSRREPEGDTYAPFLNGTQSYTPGDEGFLWVRARKSGETSISS